MGDQQEWFDWYAAAQGKCLWSHKHDIAFDEQDVHVAYLTGSVDLVDGSTLFFAQYVRMQGIDNDQIRREKYRYRWQGAHGETCYRWDNARHYPGLATFPDHVHVGPSEEAQESGPMDLWYIMSQVEQEISLTAATSLARLWQSQDKRQEAYDLLAPVYTWFTEGFDTADVQEAKALLEALAKRGGFHRQPAASLFRALSGATMRPGYRTAMVSGGHEEGSDAVSPVPA